MYDNGESRTMAGQGAGTDAGVGVLPYRTIESKPGWSRRTRSLLGVQVVSTGSYLPDNIVTNTDLQNRFGYDPAWIEQRTGILARRYARPEQATSDLCIEAAKRAIRNGRVDIRDIDLVVVGTFTPDFQCPTTANLVQESWGSMLQRWICTQPARDLCMPWSLRLSMSRRETADWRWSSVAIAIAES